MYVLLVLSRKIPIFFGILKSFEIFEKKIRYSGKPWDIEKCSQLFLAELYFFLTIFLKQLLALCQRQFIAVIS